MVEHVDHDAPIIHQHPMALRQSFLMERTDPVPFHRDLDVVYDRLDAHRRRRAHHDKKIAHAGFFCHVHDDDIFGLALIGRGADQTYFLFGFDVLSPLLKWSLSRRSVPGGTQEATLCLRRSFSRIRDDEMATGGIGKHKRRGSDP